MEAHELKQSITGLITNLVRDEVGHTDQEKISIDHTVSLIMRHIQGWADCLF